MRQDPWPDRLPDVTSKADLAYQSLRGAIADGRLRPGERVNIDALARRLGVSKIPIREAVKRLESDGLVTARVHSGATVAEIDVDEMTGVYLARAALDGLAARLAAGQAGDAAELTAVNDALRTAVADGDDAERLWLLNAAFHRALADAGGYQVLRDLTDQLLLTVRRYRAAIADDLEDWDTVVAEHDAIVAAVRRGDSEGAEAAASAHIAAHTRDGMLGSGS